MTIHDVVPTGEPPVGGPRRRPQRRWIAAAVVVALVGAGAAGVWHANAADSDADGLTDRVEALGWQTEPGTIYRTDPDKADTDGDGLTDRDEAGALVRGSGTDAVYAGWSDPIVVDTDDDGLDDGREADAGLDPREQDVDHDDLTDGREVEVLGTDPEVADTDADGFDDGYEDANRDSQGLDPVSFDEQISAATYAADFAKGALAGDLMAEDSLAWLAGDLVSSGAGSLPGVGTLLGRATHVRDAIGKAIHGDWVGSGFDALGVLSGGNPAAIPRKVEEFLARNPRLAALAASLIARSSVVPTWIKVKAAQAIWPEWDDLLRAGADEEALLRLQRGRTDLRALAAEVRRSSGRAGSGGAVPVLSGRAGEQALERRFGATVAGVDRQVRFSTAACGNSCGGDIRILDVLVDQVARESKVGYVPFSASVQKQIRQDQWLVESGQVRAAVWHFSQSSVTNSQGADPRVFALLREAGIEVRIELAKAA
mgnify:CR=1 FL=1